MTVESREIVVIGGGIAGLAAALALHEEGRDVVLLEAGPRLGGVIRTETPDGFVVEAGPDAILAQKPEGLALCRTLGLGERLVPINPVTRTVFVLHRGRLHPLPEGMMLAVPTRVLPFLRSHLFSWPGKLRMGMDLVLPGRARDEDESIASLLRRRFGTEAVERLGEPLMAGIHAGDPEQLSIQATFPRFVELERRHHSLIRGMWASRPRGPAATRPAFYSLTGGLGEMVEAVRRRLPAHAVRLAARVKGLRREAGGFAARLADGSSLRTSSVILAVPAPAAAPLLAEMSPEAGLLLQTVPFASSATVALGYRREDVAHPLDGYGMLVPRGEGLRTSACSFVSSKFPGRAPEGHVLLRAFLGGARDPDLLQLADDELAALARREMRDVLGLRGAPVLARVYRWRRATPQMTVGHLERMRRLDRIVEGLPGLFLTGAGLHGTGIPDGIADGGRAARAAAGYVVAVPPSRRIHSALCPAAS
ncbi:MAG TPA: protoporphyrinogen oxidase [Vicinamibacteria bacterium]|nr:protoporphyrinogen oxidase [Vicinamibacteria bacterium]